MNDSAPQPSERVRSILVIDDSSDVLSLCTAVLKHAGYRSHTASCGADGLAIFAREPIDLVILDMGLPDMDGEEVLAALRALRVDVRVLISSGYTREKLDRIRSEEVVGFLRKPWGLKELLEIIEVALR
ncbi:MAG: DNA-binding response OmpR family regulator [Myxococcota bacterium]|jgi:DNA-binding response OmpR family regulator